MNILLTSYGPYFYLHKDLFKSIISEIDLLSNEVYFLATDLHAKQSIDLPGVERIILMGETLQIWRKLPRVIRALLILLNCLVYRYDLSKKLKKIRPSILIVSTSDLIGFKQHILLDLCHQIDIPILIIININTLSNLPPPNSIQINSFFRKVLSALNIERAILFNGTVPGTYLSDSFLAVPGIFTEKQYLQSGIPAGRIFVTGNPVHDKLIGLRVAFSEALKNNIQISENYVVYCTEVIEFIHGEDYFYWINDQLRIIFEHLPNSIKVFVKLHPRESDKSKDYLQQIFSGPRYHIIDSTDLFALLINSRLIITHYSATIIESILVGTPVLRINVKDDQRYSELMPNNALLVATSIVEIREKLNSILFDDVYRKQVIDYLDSWIKMYSAHLDGHNTKRVVDLIGVLANKEK